jgi:hypothetical protein
MPVSKFIAAALVAALVHLPALPVPPAIGALAVPRAFLVQASRLRSRRRFAHRVRAWLLRRRREDGAARAGTLRPRLPLRDALARGPPQRAAGAAADAR